MPIAPRWSTPWTRSGVAAVCRASCRRAGRMTSPSRNAVQCNEWSRGATGRPVTVVNTGPQSRHRVPVDTRPPLAAPVLAERDEQRLRQGQRPARLLGLELGKHQPTVPPLRALRRLLDAAVRVRTAVFPVPALRLPRHLESSDVQIDVGPRTARASSDASRVRRSEAPDPVVRNLCESPRPRPDLLLAPVRLG